MGHQLMVPTYGKSVEAFDTDLFIVRLSTVRRSTSSGTRLRGQRRRPGPVPVDTLFTPDTPVKRQL